MNRKNIYAVMTILVMLITSRFFIRIIDATVQIGDDTGVLILFLSILNAAIAAAACLLYKKTSKSTDA